MLEVEVEDDELKSVLQAEERLDKAGGLLKTTLEPHGLDTLLFGSCELSSMDEAVDSRSIDVLISTSMSVKVTLRRTVCGIMAVGGRGMRAWTCDTEKSNVEYTISSDHEPSTSSVPASCLLSLPLLPHQPVHHDGRP